MKCTICGGTETKLYVQKNGYDVFECVKCMFRFVHPVPDSQSVYGEEYFAGAQKGFGYVDYDKDKEPMKPVFNEYLRRIRALHPEAKTLFDVGGATGYFLNLAREQGFTVGGVELSPFASEVARGKGIAMQTGTLADVAPELKVDVMTLLDVIEHVADPRGEIERARAHINTGGLLVLNTPDAGSAYARAFGTKWHLIVPPEHLSYFNRGHMERVLAESGFRVLEMTTIGKTFSLPYIFKTLYAWQKLSVWKWCAQASERTPLKGVALPINLRDNMFVIAQAV